MCELLQSFGCFWSLHSKLSHIVGGILQFCTNTIPFLAPLPILIYISSIYYHQILLRLIVIQNKVINNTPIIVYKTSILSLPLDKLCNIIACYLLQILNSFRTFNPKLSHVRNIKYAYTVYNS